MSHRMQHTAVAWLQARCIEADVYRFDEKMVEWTVLVRICLHLLAGNNARFSQYVQYPPGLY